MSQESYLILQCLFQLRICYDSVSNFLETAAQSSTAITTKASAVIRKGTETKAHNYANTNAQSTHIPNPACISYIKKKEKSRKGRIRKGKRRVRDDPATKLATEESKLRLTLA